MFQNNYSNDTSNEQMLHCIVLANSVDGHRIMSRHYAYGSCRFDRPWCSTAIAVSPGSTSPDHNSNTRGRSTPLTRLEGFGPTTNRNRQLLMRTGSHLSSASYPPPCLCFRFDRFCGFFYSLCSHVDPYTSPPLSLVSTTRCCTRSRPFLRLSL